MTSQQNRLKAVFVGAMMLQSIFIASRLAETYPPIHEDDYRVRPTSFRAPKDGPALAWLMSFPNSGTSYTLHLISKTSGTYFASNYGAEQQLRFPNSTLLPVYPETYPDGPYWNVARSDRVFPQDLVLTKTHCGGFCLECGPSNYVETSYSFRRRCALASHQKDPHHFQRPLFSGYSESLVERIVHLVRDPFDNVVSRFHLAIIESDPAAKGYESTLEGFRSYCTTIMNPRFEKAENESNVLESAVLDSVRDIPCYSDFFRYIEWHNQAFSLTEDMGVESRLIFYEDYRTRLKDILSDLLSFLRLRQNGEPEKFISGLTYQGYFTEEEKSRLKVVMRRLSSQTTWRHLDRYVDNITDPPNSTVVFK